MPVRVSVRHVPGSSCPCYTIPPSAGRRARRQDRPVERSSAPRRLGLLVVGHGSRRSAANDLLVSVTAALAERVPAHAVEAAFLEIARPTIAEAYAALVAAGCDQLVVHPY